jgi:hypothetical protein
MIEPMDDEHHHPNDNGNNGEERMDPVPNQRRLLAIESLEDYVQRFGLPRANNGGIGKVMHQLTIVA